VDLWKPNLIFQELKEEESPGERETEREREKPWGRGFIVVVISEVVPLRVVHHGPPLTQKNRREGSEEDREEEREEDREEDKRKINNKKFFATLKKPQEKLFSCEFRYIVGPVRNFFAAVKKSAIFEKTKRVCFSHRGCLHGFPKVEESYNHLISEQSQNGESRFGLFFCELKRCGCCCCCWRTENEGGRRRGMALSPRCSGSCAAARCWIRASASSLACLRGATVGMKASPPK